MNLKTPLNFSQFHKKFTFRDVDGRDLFEITVIRPSIEAWENLTNFGKFVCELINKEDTKVQRMEAEAQAERLLIESFDKRVVDKYGLAMTQALDLVKKEFKCYPREIGKVPNWMDEFLGV